MNLITWQHNPLRDFAPSASLTLFDRVQADRIHHYHQSWPRYQPTPLRSLDQLAAHWGLQAVLIKDESQRWGLQAFKGLGGTHGVGRYLAEYYGLSPWADFSVLKAHAFEKPPVVFATATDGNHGVGIAWAATQLGHSSKIFMPKGSSRARVQAIQRVGGDVEVTHLDYDSTVDWVASEAGKQGWVLIQDTSWEGYHKIPQWIMQGYMTMMAEEFLNKGDGLADKPTHVIVQAGVGSFATAIVAFLANFYDCDIPQVIVVEPTEAACFYRSIGIGDRSLYPSQGSLSTVMAGLACGIANPMAWEILQHWVTTFATCDDRVAARGMRILGNPLPDDPRIVAGESGAVGLGLLSLIMDNPQYTGLREMMGFGPEARVLLFNTEGATDPIMYRRIVWDGYLGES